MQTTEVVGIQDKFFVRTVKDMPFSLMKQIAEQNNIHIPIDVVGKPEEIAQYLSNELDAKTKATIVSEYGDAGHVLIYYFTCGMETPALQDLKESSPDILSLSKHSPLLENVPYFEGVEVNEFTQTYRARFHYFKGTVFLLDRKTKTIKEERRAYYGVVVYRPEKKLIEVRAKHRDVALTAAVRTASMVGLTKSIETLNFRKQEYITKFLDWIRSLNNARIELSTRGALSSITMSSKGGVDLRNLKDFQKYLEEGMLRGGHATIIEEEHKEINFRIFFRDCRVYFTSFSDEADVELVADALEKITIGFRFKTAERMMDDFFR